MVVLDFSCPIPSFFFLYYFIYEIRYFKCAQGKFPFSLQFSYNVIVCVFINTNLSIFIPKTYNFHRKKVEKKSIMINYSNWQTKVCGGKEGSSVV